MTKRKHTLERTAEENVQVTVPVALVLFTPLNSVFGLVMLSPWQYPVGLGLILVPFAVMEICKLAGFIKQHKH